jgi:hypothetical protein
MALNTIKPNEKTNQIYLFEVKLQTIHFSKKKEKKDTVLATFGNVKNDVAACFH